MRARPGRVRIDGQNPAQLTQARAQVIKATPWRPTA